MGSTMGTPADFKAMIDFVAEKELVPVVSDTFELEECQTGTTV